MYSGFLEKKQEYDYHQKINRMMILLVDQLSLQLQLNFLINKQFFDKHFYKLYNQIKELESTKVKPPKFSLLLKPLHSTLQHLTDTIIPSSPNKYASPKLESDVLFNTNFNKSESISKRSLSQHVTQSTFKPKSSQCHRICRPSHTQATSQLQEQQYMEFQNESQVSGKKTPNCKNKISFNNINIFMSPKSLEAQQSQL